MKTEPFDTPILFLIYNRPDLTEKVFGQIKKVKPRNLFIAADGPRDTNPEDKQKCAITCKIVMDMIDWDCEVKTLFRDKNLGCGLAVSQAITWFFKHVEMGIILEDDCYPDTSFFKFCEELLEYYRNDESVMHISGNNFQKKLRKDKYSYYFSHYTHNWGWATWKRAWGKNDFELLNLEDFLNKNEKESMISKKEYSYFINLFKELEKNDIGHIWDYQWLFSLWYNQGLAILPNINLVSNIGFGDDATHTTGDSIFANMPIFNMNRIVHPKNIKRDIKADHHTFNRMFKKNDSFLKKLKNNILLSYLWRKLTRWKLKIKAHRIFIKYHDYTMIPKNIFINNLLLSEKFYSIKGCVVECGVWKGGMIAGMTEILGKHRNYYLFDSFEGLPEAKTVDGKNALEWQKNTEGSFYFNNCSANESFSKKAMELSVATNYTIVKGWFDKSIPNYKFNDNIAILRLDGDWYDSTMLCLNNLYPKVAVGGIIIIDDYLTWDGCSRAIHDYLSKNNLASRIHSFNDNVYYIVKM